jgi:acetate kinase
MAFVLPRKWQPNSGFLRLGQHPLSFQYVAANTQLDRPLVRRPGVWADAGGDSDDL